MAQILFGLDFGTTNSALAVNCNGNVEIVDVDEFNPAGKTLRSVLFFDEDGRVHVGNGAIAKYIEDVSYGRYMQSIKAFLSDTTFESTEIYGTTYEIEDLVAIILRKIKEKGEEFIGQRVDSVVLGRPVVFSADSQKDVLSVGGVYIGGDTFDSRMMWDKVAPYFGRDVKIKFAMSNHWKDMHPLIYRLRSWHLIPQLRERNTRESIRKLKALADRKDLIENLENLIDDNYGFMLFQAIEKAKCELSSQEETMIFYKEFSLIIREQIARFEFEEMIKEDVEKDDGSSTSIFKQL